MEDTKEDAKTEIVISGSYRKHLEQIQTARSRLEQAGIKVLAPESTEAINSEQEFVILASDDKTLAPRRLETNFMRNIAKADFLYVANIDGYVGRSAAAEMAYARLKGIPVVTVEPIKAFSDEIPQELQDILRESVKNHLSIDDISQDEIEKLREEVGKNTFPPTPEQNKILSRAVTGLIRELPGKA